MALEIEVKSWIDDPGNVRKELDRRFTVVGEFSKHDTYYTFPDGSRYFRIRAEQGKHIVTMKRKTRNQGIEVNDETEFTVSDREKFIKFIEEAGCREYIEKRKTSRVYENGGFTVELSFVDGLGWFLEIEKLSPDDLSAEAREEIRSRLLEFLDEMGIGRGGIEGRYYIEMLAEKSRNIPGG